jgi:hypothetical protein
MARITAAERMRHNMQENEVSTEELLTRYKSSQRLTSNVIFGSGDGMLGDYARDEAIRRRKVRVDKEAAACMKRKKELTKLVGEYKEIKADMLNAGFKWNVQKLTKAIRCKTLPGDAQRPTTKEALLLHWKKIQNRPTPQPSPVSSDDEDSTNECASDEEEDHHGVMVFGEDDLDLDEFNADD